jgi:hypothetical protein
MDRDPTNTTLRWQFDLTTLRELHARAADGDADANEDMLDWVCVQGLAVPLIETVIGLADEVDPYSEAPIVALDRLGLVEVAPDQFARYVHRKHEFDELAQYNHDVYHGLPQTSEKEARMATDQARFDAMDAAGNIRWGYVGTPWAIQANSTVGGRKMPYWMEADESIGVTFRVTGDGPAATWTPRGVGI